MRLSRFLPFLDCSSEWENQNDIAIPSESTDGERIPQLIKETSKKVDNSKKDKRGQFKPYYLV